MRSLRDRSLRSPVQYFLDRMERAKRAIAEGDSVVLNGSLGFWTFQRRGSDPLIARRAVPDDLS